MGDQKLKILGFVFARGGSKGVINKNIRKIAGKPLICHAVETALKSSLIDQVIVSSDDDKIIKAARKAGAKCLFKRPSELARNTTPEWLAWQHAVGFVQNSGIHLDIFVSIPATSPLRSVADIDNCINELICDDQADAAICVTEAKRHPGFNMIEMDNNQYASILLPQPSTVARRQDTKTAYDITTVAYAVRPEFICRANALFEGKVKAVVIPEERALDIDTEFDLKVARLLMEDTLKSE